MVGRSSRRAVGGLLDAIEDGVTGLLVPPRDPVALRRSSVSSGTACSGRGSVRLQGRWPVKTFSFGAATDGVLAAYHDAVRSR